MPLANERFLLQFPHQLSDSLGDLDEQLVVRLMRQQSGQSNIEPDEADWQDVRAFAFEQRLLEVSIGSVWRVTCHALMTGLGVSKLDEKQLALLVARVLQRHSWRVCAERINVPGRSQALSILRGAVATLTQ